MKPYLVETLRKGRVGWNTEMEIIELNPDDIKALRNKNNEYIRRRFFKLEEQKK